jgi:hypothetical protein
MTEFGNLALIDQDAGEENGVAIPLPGVKKGKQRSLCILFCFLSWAAVHGVSDVLLKVRAPGEDPTIRCWVARPFRQERPLGAQGILEDQSAFAS